MRAWQRLGLTLLLGGALATAAQAQVALPVRVELKGYGLSFDIPDGWKRVPELRYTQLARLARFKDGKPVALIEIESFTARDKTLSDLASQLTAKRKAQLIGERKVEACTTIEMKLPGANGMNAAGVTIFSIHSQLVMVQASGADDASVLESMRAVTTHMAFSEPQSADLDNQPRLLTVPVFESNLRMALPDSFRPAKEEPPGRQSFFAVRNWANGRDEASVVLQPNLNPDRTPLRQIVETAAPKVAAEHGMSEPITFTKVSENPEVYLTATMPVDTSGVQRYAYVGIDPARYVLMIFGSNATDPAARERYMATAENVCKALKLISE